MKVVPVISDMQEAARAARAEGQTIGFVPTMGALHEGHLSLVRRAKQECDVTVVSVFVNPTQFGPHEDYLNYPRDPERDAALLQKEGVDILFAPTVEEMYPEGAQATVAPGGAARGLEGEFRPGHFEGVVTVVKKLFDAVRPHRACFGQKDAQQCVVIKQMVRALKLPVEVVVCPIVREPDGLAMSSRNAYLNAEERKAALVLHRSLSRARERLEAGERDADKLAMEVRGVLESDLLAKVDYAAVVDAETFQPVERIEGSALIPLAVWIGRARLLDNLRIDCEDGKFSFQL